MTIDQCPSTVKEGPKQQPGKAELIASKRSLAGTVNGMVAWRSHDELADTPEFRDFVEREFPAGASELLSTSRRTFMSLMGASLALAGVATMPGCRRPDHKILPYSKHIPEDIIPGKPLYFATSMPLPGGGAEGLIVETHEGRPTKIEGNPLHSINMGKSTQWSQASVLGLYDPDRLKFPYYKPTKKEGTWDDFAAWSAEHFKKHEGGASEGLAFIVDKKTSPSRDSVRDRLLRKFPKATWVAWDPTEVRGPVDGTTLSFGAPMREVLALSKAKVILSLDRDFLSNEPGQLTNGREFASTRIPKKTGTKSRDSHGHDLDDYAMSRLYMVESSMSLTGGQADHRLRLPPSRIVAFAVALGKFIVSKAATPGSDALVAALNAVQIPDADKLSAPFLEEAAKDLLDTANRGAAVVLAGPTMPTEVHALCHAINTCLGSMGTIVRYQPMDMEHASDSQKSLRALAAKMGEGKIQTLVVIDANPVYDAPGDLGFPALFAKVPVTVCSSVQNSETAAASAWSLNNCHFLESWGDTVANDGTIAPIQPMIAPLFGPQLTEAERALGADRPMHALSELELLALIAGDKRPDAYKIVRSVWRDRAKALAPTQTEDDFERQFRRSLQDGVLQGQPGATWVKDIMFPEIAQAVQGLKIPAGPANGAIDVVFTIGHVHDGRFANLGWLQELPEAGTMVCWDNPALMSPATAVKLKLWPENPKENRYTDDKWPKADMAEITIGGRTIKCAVWVLPGMADDTVILKCGYGREVSGRVADGVGFNVYPARGDHATAYAGAGTVKKTDGDYWIASTQNHWSLEGRTSIVRAVDLPVFAHYAGDAPKTYQHEMYKTNNGAPVEEKLNFAEQFGELTHTPPNLSIYKHPYNDSTKDAKAGSKFSKGPQWGMTIDLSTCTGCGTCTIACQSENNIPIVGKKETAKGREMTWIRIDRYFTGYNEGDAIEMMSNPEEMLHQPIACVHCEYAPCETVCPVNATVHTPDGMNAMAYNRCIGTRYCANNCPYKVRRFNYFDYGVTKFNGDYYGKDKIEKVAGVLPNENSGATGSTRHGTLNPNLIPPRLREKLDQIERMQKNPDVTVRSRGVMEKCSYCVQRINAARIEINTSEIFPAADRNKIPDGFFQTACQQACPSNSITFGDILDKNEYTDENGVKRHGSKVSIARDDPRSYALLGYLLTRPRTSHMMRVRNPNKALLERDPKGKTRVENWEKDPFNHGHGSHDSHGDGHEGHDHGPEEKHSVRFDQHKRAEDRGYRASLTVLGGVKA